MTKMTSDEYIETNIQFQIQFITVRVRQIRNFSISLSLYNILYIFHIITVPDCKLEYGR